MIKLTNLLKEIVSKELEEIDLMSGDADVSTSLDLLAEYIHYGPRDFYKLLRQVGIDVNVWRIRKDPKMDELPDPRIVEYIKQNAVDSQGQLYVLVNKDKNSSRLIHSLFKIDEPLKTMFVGKIATRDSEGPYSMKRMYGVDGKQVGWSHFAKEYKGLGYGSFLYDTVLYRYGVLESDDTLYQGSQKMWMFHMPRVAEFFGGTVKNPGGWGGGGTGRGASTLVIPLTVDDVMDRGFVKNSLGSFVAFHDSVPSEVIKTATLSNGLSYREGTLGVMFYDLSIKDRIWDDAEKGEEEYDSFHPVGSLSFIDWLESEKEDTSFEEIIWAMTKIADMSYRKLKPDAAQVVFVLAEDATVVISKKGDSYDYTLL